MKSKSSLIRYRKRIEEKSGLRAIMILGKLIWLMTEIDDFHKRLKECPNSLKKSQRKLFWQLCNSELLNIVRIRKTASDQEMIVNTGEFSKYYLMALDEINKEMDRK